MDPTAPQAPSLTNEPERSIAAALFRLALPVLASHGLRLAFQWVDALWVRDLGVAATAAVTSSIYAIWWLYSLNDVVAIGAMAYVSQLLGAGDRPRAGVAAYRAVRASGLLGLGCALAGWLWAPQVFQLMRAAPEIADAGSRYLGVVLLGSPFLMVALTGESVMRASGDTRTPLLLDLGAVALNAVLAPLLIFGLGPFPRMGVAGAAWATVFAQAILAASYLWLAAKGHRAFPFARRAEGPPVKTLGMARVGLPAAIIGAMFAVVYICFARAASEFGPASMAVVGIVNRIEALQFIVTVAIGTAGAALVGQNLGAGRPDRAELVIKTGLRWSMWISGTLTVLFFAIPEVFLSMFTPDPEVHRLGAPYIRILSLCIVVNGLEIVTAESILGSGHTRALSTIFTSFSLLRIPLAFVAPHWQGLGVLGIAWVITITCVVRGLLILLWASRGTWKSGLRRELHAPEGPQPQAVSPVGGSSHAG